MIPAVAMAAIWDHPRIRGEHVDWTTVTSSVAGSSPHTRGAHPRGGPGDRRAWIIPAYAGSTSRACPIRRLSGDHPRIRGEHGTNTAGDFARPGSSPHTRGARCFAAYGDGRLGIIPAYAGST